MQDHPKIGRAREEIAGDARPIVIERRIALYRIVGNEAQIVRIVDGARDLAGIQRIIE